MVQSSLGAGPVGRHGLALLLNNTATSYHWGCYATSMMLIDAVTRQGFAVNALPVEVTHFGLVSPETVAAIDDDHYLRALRRGNPIVLQMLADCDIVIVNGEGTLHRFHDGPRGLLALMRFAKRRLGRPVVLLNHSIFPSGDEVPAAPEIESFYRDCLSSADVRVAREDRSMSVYRRLGLPAVAGFDALPLYADRFLNPLPSCPSLTLIGAASQWRDREIDAFARALVVLRDRIEGPPMFLSGGYRREPPEDAVHYARLKTHLPDLGILRPDTLGEWLGLIAASRLFITGRFHHLVAGAALGTPMVAMPGNTAKVEAVCDLVGFRQPMAPDNEGFVNWLAGAIGTPAQTTEGQRRMLVERAALNFEYG